MVKITSSYVNVYTASETEIGEMQRLLSNTTPKKNDIPTIYENVLNGSQGYMVENKELESDATLDENNNSSEARYPKIKRNVHSESDIRLLLSPKLKRRTIHTEFPQRDCTIKTQLKKSYTTEDVSPDASETSEHEHTCRARAATLNSTSEKNSYLLSPRIKRKQIDITKSSAYKEIYAHNLRLYSAVLAKQIAATSQVGKEMDDIRRTKIKQKALHPNFRFGRSQSMLDCSEDVSGNPKSDFAATKEKLKAEATEFNDPAEESNLKNTDTIDGSATSTIASDIDEKCLSTRARSKSEIPIMTSKNELVTSRRRAATLRSENIRQKLDSFDKEMDKTSEFLAKLKTSPK